MTRQGHAPGDRNDDLTKHANFHRKINDSDSLEVKFDASKIAVKGSENTVGQSTGNMPRVKLKPHYADL
jgi:hypothetical protein